MKTTWTAVSLLQDVPLKPFIMKSLDLKIPTQWNQLTRSQLLFVCRLFVRQVTEHQFKLLVFLRFTGVKALPRRIIADQVFYFFRKGRVKFSLSIPELHYFTSAANYLLSDSQLTRNILPRFRILWRCFHGPANKCYNISFLEFLHAEAVIYRFHVTRRMSCLRHLCAILYRPAARSSFIRNGQADKREPFNDFVYIKRSRWFRMLSPAKLYGVYIFYIGCRNALMKAHPRLFSGGTEVSSTPVNPVESIKKLMFELNQGDVTKNPQIQQMQVWEAFYQLEQMIIQGEEIRKSYSTNKK